jgi:hypothetical protein
VETTPQPDSDGARAATRPGPVSTPATATSLPRRLRAVWAEHMGEPERALLVSWAAFGATFATTRLVTHRLRRGGGAGGIVLRGRHIHHYNFGIALLAAVGGAAVWGQADSHRHPATATAYGSGVALIVDELALLLDLQDVYWGTDGRTSVDVAVGTIATGGVYLAAAPFWHSAVRELARTFLPARSARKS